MSCGDDMNWMVWKIGLKSVNKGIISGQHSRTIYSCDWVSTQKVNLIATAGGDNKIMVYDVNTHDLKDSNKFTFQFNTLINQVYLLF